MFSIGLTVLVGLLTLIIGIDALNQHFKRVIRFLTVIKDAGAALKAHKNRCFELPWVASFPMSADTLTAMRLVGVVVSLTAFTDGNTPFAVGAFIISWFFDLLDGRKSILEARQRTQPSRIAPTYNAEIGGYPTWYGKYLDPIMDLICFVLIAWVLAPLYPPRLIAVFIGAIGLRIGLYLVLFVGRHFWFKRLPPLLPKSLAGEYKTVFIFLSAILVIAWRSSSTALQLAGVMMGIAIVLEFGSLLQQIWRAIILVRHPVIKPTIVPYDRTGTD